MAPAPPSGRVVLPLDEQLGLDGAGGTPRGQEALVRLATWMSFEQACELFTDLVGIQVSATGSRRYTYQAGPAALVEQQAEEEHIRPDLPEPPSALQTRHPTVSGLGEKLAYLEKREAQRQYPTDQEAGWPIGSGSVESANKLVVEARLKGAGRHGERAHVNAMLVLGKTVCNGRWQQRQQRFLGACGKRLLLSQRLNALPQKPRVARYSWRQPFLRRPPACQQDSAKISAPPRPP